MALHRVLTPEIDPASLAALDFGQVLLTVSAMAGKTRPGFESLGRTQPALDYTDGPTLYVGLGGLEQQPLPCGQHLRDGMDILGDLRILWFTWQSAAACGIVSRFLLSLLCP